MERKRASEGHSPTGEHGGDKFGHGMQGSRGGTRA
jgi:hypothetical protein